MRHSPTQLSFPCEFPLKILGWADQSIEEYVLPVLYKYIPELSEDAIRINHSKAQKYVSLTVKFQAQNQAQLDGLYQELKNLPPVLMTL